MSFSCCQSHGSNPKLDSMMLDRRPPAHTSPSVQSYSSQAIRDSSNRLASLSFTARPRRRSSASGSSGDNGIATSPLSTIRVPPDHRPIYPSHLAVSTNEHGISPSKGGLPGSGGNAGRSTLSVMLEREDEKRRQAEVRHPTVQSAIPEVEEDSASPQPDAGRLDSTSSSSSEVEGSGDGTPVARRGSLVGCSKQSEEEVSPSSSMHQSLPAEDRRDDLEVASERTPLLTSPTGRATGVRNRAQLHLRYIRQRVSKITARDMARNVLLEPVKTLPCVILGVLLNVLDGVSYGMIL